MEPEETATIVRLVKSVFPQQPIDRATYDTWHLVIGHLEFGAANAAVIAIAHSERFCSAADIIREAGRAAKARAHPSDRPVGEALAFANRRELDSAAGTPATQEFLSAKAAMIARQKARDQAAYLADQQAQRRAQAWLDYQLSGRQPTDWPLMAPAAPRWVQLPGDPPGLRAWLARQPPEAA